MTREQRARDLFIGFHASLLNVDTGPLREWLVGDYADEILKLADDFDELMLRIEDLTERSGYEFYT